jgi:hypothetical protein
VERVDIKVFSPPAVLRWIGYYVASRFAAFRRAGMLISDSDIANYVELVDPLRESSRTSIAIDEKGS